MDTATKTWQSEMTVVALLYLIGECKKKIPTDISLLADEEGFDKEQISDISFLKEIVAEMYQKELVDIKGKFWEITDKGRSILGKIVQMYDHALKFEIFSNVLLTRGLTEDEQQEDDEYAVLDYIYDPRFISEENDGAEDLRIAMFTFLTEQAESEQELDPHRIVFIQKLIDNELRSKTFFFDLLVGTFFSEIEKIVISAYQWRDIGGDEENSINIMRSLYTAGMLEQRKHDGQECSQCGIPLAIFELIAKDDGEELTNCPNPDCGESYEPRTITEMVDVEEPAEYEEVTECLVDPYEYEDPWAYSYDYYDYEPYGYYDPWDPLDDAAFLCLCAVLW